MNEYILFMHDDVLDAGVANDDRLWEAYLGKLRASGRFDGGSVIGPGAMFRKDGSGNGVTTAVSGFIRIRAENMEAAREFLVGNPTFEAGGTVEIRRVPRG